jgi:hypothetical protein
MTWDSALTDDAVFPPVDEELDRAELNRSQLVCASER